MNQSISDLNSKIIRKEGQLKSPWQSQCSFKQAHSVEISDDQDSQQQLSYSKKASDTENSLSTGQYMKQGSDLFASVTLTTKFSCNLCRHEIDENAIITPCQHPFHQNCLRDQLYIELRKKEHFIKCTCGFELNQMLKIQYREDKKVYEDIIKFEINNIKQNIRQELILECEGGQYQLQIQDESSNIIYEEGWCNSFFINDQQSEGQLSTCLICGRRLFNPLKQMKINKPKIRLLNQQQL